MTERTHFVYRAYDADGQLLYIGCTKSPQKRMAQHKYDRRWFADATRFRLSGPYPEARAFLLEAEAIKAERPLHNYMHLKQSWCQRRAGWIDRQTNHLLRTEGWDGTTQDFYRKYEQASALFEVEQPIGPPTWEVAA